MATETTKRSAEAVPTLGTMRAARAHPGEKTMRLEEIPVPPLDAGDVLVKVEASGLTRGLVGLWKRGMIQLLPATLSAEMAGTVAKVGPDVIGWKTGDRVRVHPTLSCRACEYCVSEREPMCASVSLIGHMAYSPEALPLYERYHNGGLAEYVKAPAGNLDPLPDNVSFAVASRVHSMGTAYRALRKAQLAAGSTLVVNAASGATGGTVLRFARLFGVTRAIAVARSAQNLERARGWDPELIETIALESLPAGWEERDGLFNRLQTLTGQRGADALIDFMPTASTATAQSIRALRKGGTAVLSGGNYGELAGLRYGDIMRGGWRIEGNQGYARSDARAVLRLLGSGAVNLDDMITHRLGLGEVMRCVELIETRAEAPLYIVIEPGR